MIHISRYHERIPGLPDHGRFVTLTNSELSRLPCLRRYYFSEIEGLKIKSTRKMDLGTAWDTLLEHTWSFVATHDRPFPRVDADLVAQVVAQMDPDPEEVEPLTEQLTLAWRGWLTTYNGGYSPEYQVIGTQLPFARLITHPRTGAPLIANLYLEERNGRMTLARAGLLKRDPDPLTAQWPVYYLGRLDVLLRHRRSHVGWVMDAKYTGAPKGYEAKMLYDPQLPGYSWLLQPHLAALGMTEVTAFSYDVTNSTPHAYPRALDWKPPTVEAMKAQLVAQGIPTKGLKTSADYQHALGITPGHGGFSLADRTGTPSWLYREALTNAGIDPTPYQEHLAHLEESVDPNLYRRPFCPVSKEGLDRFGAEVYAKAKQVIALREAAATATDRLDIELAFPRTAICQAPGGSCSFSSLCVQDSREGRATYEYLPSLSWSEDGEPK